MSLPEQGLARASHAGGREGWWWLAGDRAVDMSAAGLPDDLGAVAQWLLDPQARATSLDAADASAATADLQLRRPGLPGKALCLGKNFAAHAREFGAEPPTELVWFAKLPDVLTGPGAPVEIPGWLETRVDPEAEVVVLVGAHLKNATAAEAGAAVAAYTLGNDVTARKQQGLDRDRGWPWLRCKNLHTFGPIGPAWVPTDLVGDEAGIELTGIVNGEVRQQASLADLEWPTAKALAEISRWTPLVPGDIVFLGTPAGVAPIQAGDQLAVSATGLGTLGNPVVAAPGN